MNDLRSVMKRALAGALCGQNPSLWIIVSFLAVSFLVPLAFGNRFPFGKIRFFTLLYTYALLVLTHTLLNFSRFRKFRPAGRRKIYMSYLQVSLYLLPYSIAAFFYDNMALYLETIPTPFGNADILFMEIDRVLFSVHPAIWLEQLVWPPAVDFFMFGYDMFFVYPFCILIYLIQKDRLDIFNRVLLAQIISLVFCYVSFVLFPASGPRYLFDPAVAAGFKDVPHFTVPLGGIEIGVLARHTPYRSLYHLQVAFWNSLETIRTDCMPSMHACLSLICLFYAVRFRKIFRHVKATMAFWITGVAALMLSTVYLRYHWVIDVIAGTALAFASYGLAEMASLAWERFRARSGCPPQRVPWLAPE